MKSESRGARLSDSNTKLTTTITALTDTHTHRSLPIFPTDLMHFDDLLYLYNAYSRFSVTAYFYLSRLISLVYSTRIRTNLELKQTYFVFIKHESVSSQNYANYLIAKRKSCIRFNIVVTILHSKGKFE